ncbi:dematin-like isoform X2 [Paramacrobiotus metropolitanus]|uniref:dematin-like isoform X2 n=1 Tax=Paramacrobiotus metropolitanus TaxID=2943436 RepID=UPI002445719B|nr:dematin-like isoform X2 [Paramacrobiotus metropolitanus]
MASVLGTGSPSLLASATAAPAYRHTHAATLPLSTLTTTTPSAKRKLSFKMVEEDTSAADNDPEQAGSQEASTAPEMSGRVTISATDEHSQSQSLGMHQHLSSSGRHSPHIPRSSRPQSPSPLDWAEAGKVYTQAYLPPDHEPTYMLAPHQPHPTKVPDYHRPEGQGVKIRIPTRRRGMDILRDACITQSRENVAYSSPSGRRSPHMNNEEPIALSTYPDARPTPATEPPKIERDDFPAPPYVYADPDRRRRISEGSSRTSKSDTGEEDVDENILLDPGKTAELVKEEGRIRKEAEELKKISSGIGRVFLHNIEERSRIKHERFRRGLDPRNASRTASANREPQQPPRYGSPAFASPSRLDDRPRPWEEWDFTPPPQMKWRSASSGASTLPSYSIPRPGYGLSTATTPKSSTLPQVGRMSPGIPELIFDNGTFISDDMHKSQSGEFASTTLPDYIFDRHRGAADMMLVRSKIVEPYFQADFLEPLDKVVPVVRKDRTIYPVHKLLVTNRRLPDDVDRGHLELHLATEDFLNIFRMSHEEFYRLPEWKRNELKKRVKLF